MKTPDFQRAAGEIRYQVLKQEAETAHQSTRCDGVE